MKTKNSKQVIIKLNTKYTYCYIDERILRCVANSDIREMRGLEFINEDWTKSGQREVVASLDINNIKFFKAEFKKTRLYKDVVSIRVKANEPNYDSVFEYHMPCMSINMLGQSHSHERYDLQISFIHNRIKYDVHYCNWCYEHQSCLTYDYGHRTRLLFFIVNQSGLFEGNLYWHRHNNYDSNPNHHRFYDNEGDTPTLYNYEEIYSDTYNKYYIKTLVGIPELM